MMAMDSERYRGLMLKFALGDELSEPDRVWLRNNSSAGAWQSLQIARAQREAAVREQQAAAERAAEIERIEKLARSAMGTTHGPNSRRADAMLEILLFMMKNQK